MLIHSGLKAAQIYQNGRHPVKSGLAQCAPSLNRVIIPHLALSYRPEAMFNRQKLIERVQQRLDQELRQQPLEQERLLSITLPLPGIHFQELPKIPGNWMFWGYPREEEYLLGMGEAKRIATSGEERLKDLADGLEREQWLRLDPEETGFEPSLFLAFAFSQDDPMDGPWLGLPNTALFLPELLLRQQNQHCVITFSAVTESGTTRDLLLQRWIPSLETLTRALGRKPASPGCKTSLTQITAEPSAELWERIIEEAKEEITAGRLDKVVTARHIRVRAQRHLDPNHLMATLNCLYPGGMLFAAHLGPRLFASATPERLASCRGDAIVSDAIGGTSGRSAEEQRDHELGQALLNNRKALHEHALVVQTIDQSLAPLCQQIQRQERPELIQLRGLQHLRTEVHGTLKPGIRLLEAVRRLHPTGAVNGVPTAEASAWLKRNEPFSRGWYTGAAGWLDARGDGTLAVLLRCALLDGKNADLFAGAGITAGSDPVSEFEEIELKLDAMLEALENA